MHQIKVTKAAMATMILSGVAVLSIASPANAQHSQGGPRVNSKALEKTTFYNAPREIQIIDDRPVVRDFREAPSNPQSIELPPGPGGGGGNPGGGGAGALDGGGGPANIPAGGLHMGGPDPGYRTPMGQSVPLAKSGFGRDTNIPARGMGPAGALPDATSTNRLMGKMMNPSTVKGVAAGQQHGLMPMNNRAAAPVARAPVQSSYGGYGGSGSGSGGSSGVTQSFVKGSLLRGK